MSLDDERIVDTWIVSPTATKNLFEHTQRFYVARAEYVRIRIEWLSFCSKSRAIHVEWRREDELEFSPIPAASLYDAIYNVFEYEEPILTFRINRYLSNHVLLDTILVDSVINRLDPQARYESRYETSSNSTESRYDSAESRYNSPSNITESSSNSTESSSNSTESRYESRYDSRYDSFPSPSPSSSTHHSPTLLYSTTDPLPQGVSLDPYEGTLSGYPTLEQSAQPIRVCLSIQYENRSEEFQTLVAISIIGSFF